MAYPKEVEDTNFLAENIGKGPVYKKQNLNSIPTFAVDQVNPCFSILHVLACDMKQQFPTSNLTTCYQKGKKLRMKLAHKDNKSNRFLFVYPDAMRRKKNNIFFAT